MNVNEIRIEGNLTREPELKSVGDNTVINFSIAYGTRIKDQSGEWVDGQAMFFDVEYWPKDPQYYVSRLTKGQGVVVFGSLRQSTWTTSEGDKRSRVNIRAQRIFSKWLPEVSAGGGHFATSAPTQRTAYQPPTQDYGSPEDCPF